MKKYLTILMAVCMAVSVIAMPYTACAAQEQPADITNPVYSGMELPCGAPDGLSDSSAQSTYKGVTYYSKGIQLYNLLKRHFIAKKESITLHCLSKTRYTNRDSANKNFLFDLLLATTDDELSVSCVDGDYLRWHIMGFGVLYNDDVVLDCTKNGYYHYTFKATAIYNSTKAEDRQTDKAIDKYIRSLNTQKMTDYEIIKHVHDHICKKTTYAYEAAGSVEDAYYHPYAFSAYGALVKGRCVCQGYALAFYRICKELGYKARFVSSNNRGNHAWNIVMLDNKYYVVDATWDDQLIDEDLDTYPRNYYLLCSYSASRANDGLTTAHTFDEAYYDNTYFNKHYRKYLSVDDDYERDNDDLLSQMTVSLSSTGYTFDGKVKKPSVTVTCADGTRLEQGTDYTVSYPTAKNTGYYKVVINGLDWLEGDATHRCFVIKPKKAATPKAKAVYSTAAKLAWQANGGKVSGYSVERYNGGIWEEIGSGASSTQTVKITPAAKQTLRVRAYKLISNRRIYGAYSNTVTVYAKPLKPQLTDVAGKKNKLKVYFEKQACSGYQLQYSTKKNMKGAKTVYVNAEKTSRAIRSLKSNKRYYVRMRAFKDYQVNGKTKRCYGVWSAKKEAKTK